MKGCNHHNKIPYSGIDQIDHDLLVDFTERNSIYICTDSLIYFAENFLNDIQGSFTLVSGDSDKPVDIDLLQNPAILKMLEDARLSKWYAQNLLTEHEKIVQIPIGMDYHTLWNFPEWCEWGLKRQSPIAQEHALLKVFESALPFEKRLFSGYCNWHFHLDRGDRQDCFAKLDKQISFVEKHPLSRISTWQRQAEMMFVTSPQGVGVDCHRTWEALLLGCIPVIKRSSFARIFEDLPVVILNDWSEFNPTTMNDHLNMMIGKKYNYAKLFNKYWSSMINNRPEFNLPRMSMIEFKEFLCSSSY